MTRRTFFIILPIFLSSCIPKMDINNYAAKNDFKIIKITNLSLFNGNIKFSNSRVKDEKHKMTFLLYTGDSLKFIAPEKRISESEPYLFKFQKINDSINIISRENHGRYYETDTSLFSNNYCIRKISIFGFERPEDANKIISGDFTIYHFDNGNLIYQSKYISPISSDKSETILSCFQNIIQNPTSIKPYAIVPYSNRDSTMLNFFTEIYY